MNAERLLADPRAADADRRAAGAARRACRRREARRCSRPASSARCSGTGRWPRSTRRRPRHAARAGAPRADAAARRRARCDGLREYAFQHQILHQVTYDTVLKRHRRELHAKVARWLANLTAQGGLRAGDFLGVAAEHFERAGDAARCRRVPRPRGRARRTALGPRGGAGARRPCAGAAG